MAQSTRDYKKFKLSKQNRDLQTKHVQHLGKSIALYPDLFQHRPILVTSDMIVIDGQHRLAAAKLLGIPVWYEVADDMTIDAAIHLNQYQANWLIPDFAKAYAAQGIKDYQLFLEFMDVYKNIPPTVLAELIDGRQRGKSTSHFFRLGEFKVLDEFKARAEVEKLDGIIELSHAFSQFKVLRAMRKIMAHPEYNHERMLEKLGRYSINFNQYGTGTDLLRNIEELYNWNAKERVRLF